MGYRYATLTNWLGVTLGTGRAVGGVLGDLAGSWVVGAGGVFLPGGGVVEFGLGDVLGFWELRCEGTGFHLVGWVRDR